MVEYDGVDVDGMREIDVGINVLSVGFRNEICFKGLSKLIIQLMK